MLILLLLLLLLLLTNHVAVKILIMEKNNLLARIFVFLVLQGVQGKRALKVEKKQRESLLPQVSEYSKVFSESIFHFI